jgi:hypothetical protein
MMPSRDAPKPTTHTAGTIFKVFQDVCGVMLCSMIAPFLNKPLIEFRWCAALCMQKSSLTSHLCTYHYSNPASILVWTSLAHARTYSALLAVQLSISALSVPSKKLSLVNIYRVLFPFVNNRRTYAFLQYKHYKHILLRP